MDKIAELQRMIDESTYIVFFGGAGVSTESGIKDFRSVDGLYSMKYKFPPEEILSRSFFNRLPEEFYIFYKDKLNCLDKEPNICHKYLAELEKTGKLKGVITQNVDGLHTKAGSVNVQELHGSMYRNHCVKCGRFYGPEAVFGSPDIIPRCEKCGGIIKPDVVLYEESLDYDVITESIDLISKADMLIIAGTSLTVYPASGFINYFRGKHLVIINRDLTPFDSKAELTISDSIGSVFSQLHT